MSSLVGNRRGPKPVTDVALVTEIARLQRENERLQAREWKQLRVAVQADLSLAE